jgi:hypothetical protein
MTRRLPILLTAIFFLATLASSARAQGLDTGKHGCKSDKGITVCYNKFRDETGVTSKPTMLNSAMRALMTRDVPVLMSAFSFKGQKPAGKIDNVFFVVGMIHPERLGTTTITSHTFAKDTKLTFLIDGEWLEIAPGDKVSDWMYEEWGEAMQYPLTREQLERLVNAKTVEMEVGPRQNKLNKGHLEGLRGLLKEIERLETK